MPGIPRHEYSRYAGLNRKRRHAHDFPSMHDIMSGERKTSFIQVHVILQETSIGCLTNENKRRSRMNLLRLVAVFIVILDGLQLGILSFNGIHKGVELYLDA